MTIKEFYEWAQKNDCENYDVLITYHDEYRAVCYDDLKEADFTLDRDTKEVMI